MLAVLTVVQGCSSELKLQAPFNSRIFDASVKESATHGLGKPQASQSPLLGCGKSLASRSRKFSVTDP